jgi:hypothetical protein
MMKDRYQRDQIPPALGPVVERSLHDSHPPRVSETARGNVCGGGVRLESGYLIESANEARNQIAGATTDIECGAWTSRS